ncbi:MAG TPA: hypothetical protein VHS79_15645 [Actinomycetes bacterium]|nr:hypothetical protein [Actinomycetes bacterium]
MAQQPLGHAPAAPAPIDVALLDLGVHDDHEAGRRRGVRVV